MKKFLFQLSTACLLIIACKHEKPDPLPPKKGNLPNDFFLIGEYYCYKAFDYDSMNWEHFDIQDSLYLRISSVENGFSTMTWKIKDVIIASHRIASYSIPWDLDAYNTHCNCNESTVKCYDENGQPSNVFKCYPNGVNFGYYTDSIFEPGSLLRNGTVYYRKTP
jgi:hypothetical protein